MVRLLIQQKMCQLDICHNVVQLIIIQEVQWQTYLILVTSYVESLTYLFAFQTIKAILFILTRINLL